MDLAYGDMTEKQRQVVFNKAWNASGQWPEGRAFPWDALKGSNSGTRAMTTEVVSQGFKVILADVPTQDGDPRGSYPVISFQVAGVDNPDIDQATADYIRAYVDHLLGCALAYHVGGMELLESELAKDRG